MVKARLSETARMAFFFASQKRSQDFSTFQGGGGHTVSNIIMAFLPRNIVGYLLKKGLQRGGHGHPRTPLATPLQVRDFFTF